MGDEEGGRAGASKSRDPSGLETGEVTEKRGKYEEKHNNNKNPQLFLLGEGGRNCKSESECSSCPDPGKARLYFAPKELLEKQLRFETLLCLR